MQLAFLRALLLADGTSDVPLGNLVARIGLSHGYDIDPVYVEPGRLPGKPRTIRDRLKAVLDLDPEFDLVIVHRDAESEPRDSRLAEIERDLAAVGCALPHIPVIPIRMTEAWLLGDEAKIREAAGNPNGRMALSLPAVNSLERIADAKGMLKAALAAASGTTGRRRKSEGRQFPTKRRWLIEKLDLDGPVSTVPAFIMLKDDVATVLGAMP